MTDQLRRHGPGVLLFLGFWLLLLAGGRSSFLRDPGTFWHTRVGEKILDDGFFDTDPYTFTFSGQRWIPHQWLGEVLMAILHRVGGLDALLVVSTGVLAGLFAWLAVRLLRTGLHPVACIGFMALTLAAAASHFHIRPHLATIVCLAITAAMLNDFDAGRGRAGRLGWLVPLFLIWTNFHGGMLGGLTTFGLVGIGWCAFRVVGLSSPLNGFRDAVGVALIGLACGLTAFVTPYGSDIARTWLDIMNAPRLPEIIREHARLSITDPTAWPLIGLAAVYLFVLAGVKPRDWRVTWLIPLFWMLQAYARVRHAPLFAVVACIAVADIWPATRWARWLANRRPDFVIPALTRSAWGWSGTLAVTACIGAALTVQTVRIEAPLVGRGWARLDPDYWPVEIAPTLKKFEPHSPGADRLFNEYIDGGFVIYHAPGYRVFVDDRCELFGDEWLVKFVEAEAEPAVAIRSWEAEYGRFEFALTRTGSGYDGYFRKHKDEWEQVRETPTATFYRRR